MCVCGTQFQCQGVEKQVFKGRIVEGGTKVFGGILVDVEVSMGGVLDRDAQEVRWLGLMEHACTLPKADCSS